LVSPKSLLILGAQYGQPGKGAGSSRGNYGLMLKIQFLQKVDGSMQSPERIFRSYQGLSELPSKKAQAYGLLKP
jgi:hypothetical protein